MFRSRPLFLQLCLGLLLLAAPAEADLASDAADAFQRQDWPAAAEAYQQLCEASPEQGALWFRLGLSRQGLKDAEGALAAYERALQAGFQRQAVLFEMARSHALLERSERTLELLEEVAGLGESRRIANGLGEGEEWAKLAETGALAPIVASLTPCSDPEYRQFDFWLGDWTVRRPGGQLAGTNRVTSHLGGCLLVESWQGAGGHEGMSLNYYDHRDASWNQIFLDNTGNVESWPPLKGRLIDGEMVLESPKHAQPRTRWTWTPLEGHRVRQWAEASSDGGETWNTIWDSVYAIEE